MNKFNLIIVLLIITVKLSAQNIDNAYVDVFAYQVKQIDEFIERFNNDHQTLIQQYYKRNNQNREISREQLIKSLFNAGNKNWNINEIKSFINLVNNKEKPLFLDFFGNNWYVKLECPVLWKGQSKTVALNLQVEKDNVGGSKWVITEVEASFLRHSALARDTLKKVHFDFPAPQDSTITLHPLSYATEFMNIVDVSKNRNNLSNYFSKATVYQGDLPQFVIECESNHLIIKGVDSVVYYFSQIDGWVFEVRQFNRQTMNSGWLISSLMRTDKNK